MTTHFDGEESNTLFNSLEEGGQGVFSLMVDPRQVIAVNPDLVNPDMQVPAPTLPTTATSRPIRVGEELRIDIRPDSVSPKANDVTVVWSNGFEGTAYQVRAEDVGTKLFATARFAGQDMRPLEIKIECGNVLVGPPPVVDPAKVVITSDEEFIQSLVPVEISMPLDAFSATVDSVEVDWLLDGSVFASEEGIPAEEDGAGYYAQFTPADDHGGQILSVRVTGRLYGCEDAVTTINAGMVEEGREIIFDAEETIQLLPPKVDRESLLTIDPTRFDPVPTSLSMHWMIDGIAVEDQQGPTFSPEPAHRGRLLSVLVVAEREGYLSTAVDVSFGKILPGESPVNISKPPKLKGQPTVGKKLKVAGLDWQLFEPAPDSIEYQWMRSKEQIAGARKRTYTVTPNDLGHKVWTRIFVRRNGHETGMFRTNKVRIK